MRNTVIYAYLASPNIIFPYTKWDHNYDDTKLVFTDEEIVEALKAKLPLKEKNGVKIAISNARTTFNYEGSTFYIIPETHPYFNLPLMMFYSEFAEDHDEMFELNDLFANNIIKK